VNWDLISESAIERVDLIAGSSPLFGQNALGGSLAIRTKNGFDDPGSSIEGYSGSFGRYFVSFESGGSRGEFGWFATASYLDEQGWRDASPSNAFTSFATLSWRVPNTAVDLHLGYGDTRLTGNGATPVQLLRQNWRSIFTSPDITENHMTLANLELARWLTSDLELTGNVYYRANRVDSFNGDGTDFQDCTNPADAGFLCDDGAPVTDQSGAPVSDRYDAIENRSRRDQNAEGGSLQATALRPVLGLENHALAGASYSQGDADFDAGVELAQLTPDRSTAGSGLFVPADATQVSSQTRTTSLYLSDTLSLTPALALTLSGRYDWTRIRLRDESGLAPELDGDHRYSRFNPSLGFTWQPFAQAGVYASYGESSRAPTPVELACASPDAPCSLPNAFVSDPPLEQVVARTWEVGLRGDVTRLDDLEVGTVHWSLSLFRATNDHDILFESTGGATSNQGFFANVGATRREGVEFGLRGRAGEVDWYASYSFVHATFLDPFTSSSPNNPFANAEGDIFVHAGDHIPGIPEHSVKLGADFPVTGSVTFGTDLLLASSQVLRGDESNQLDPVGGYTVWNARLDYRYNEHLRFFARLENLLDSKYESFGMLGEPAGVLGSAYTNPRFLGPGPRRGAWLGIKLSL
jgi:outer membrane receptor protein involved in Fe transport